MKKFLSTIVLICSTVVSAMPISADETASVSNRQYFRGSEPRLIAKSKEYFLHAILGTSPYSHRSRLHGDGTALTHTSRETGKMAMLYSSGNFAFQTVRMSFAANRILGVVNNENRIYLCVWGTGQVFDRLPQVLTLDKGSISLLVFNGTYGTLIQELSIRPDKDLSKRVAEDNLEVGPLLLVKNGVSCFGQTFEFDKDRLVLKK